MIRKLIIAAAGIAIVGIVAGCAPVPNFRSRSRRSPPVQQPGPIVTPPPAPVTRTVVYEFQSERYTAARLAYTLPNGSESITTDTPLPFGFTDTFPVTTLLAISAYLDGPGWGICRIRVDGILRAETTVASSDANRSVTCVASTATV